MPGPKAVIYDMDGVIIDSEPIWQEVEIEVFGRHGIALTREMCTQTMGRHSNEVVDYWMPDASAEARAAATDELTQDVITHVRGRKPMKGVRESIAYFESLGLPLAIASSSFYALINAVLDEFELRPHFSVVHSAEGEAKGKPDPSVYLSTARKLGVQPSECVAIEDSVNGVKSALTANMRVIAVPFNNDPVFDSTHTVVDSLNEIDDALWNRLWMD